MSIGGYEVLQRTNHYTVTRHGGRNYYHRDCWVRTSVGDVVLAGIRIDLLGEPTP